MVSQNSSDIRSDSGFLEDDNITESKIVYDDKHPEQKCSIDEIACFMRSIDISDVKFRRTYSEESVDSLVSTLSAAQSEDRKSILKSVSSYKRKQGFTEKRQFNSETKHENVGHMHKVKDRKPSNSVRSRKTERCKSSPVKRTVSINTPDNQHQDYHYKKSSKSNYDSRLERSKSFLHGQSKVFSKASQYLTPAKPGLQKLQVCYSKTNIELNSGKIFGDLVKTAHKQNIVICDSVQSIERRLFRKRTDPTKKTTYFENMNKPDPYRVTSKPKKALTVAEKKKERKERIAETTEEIKLGFKRTAKTVKLLSPEEVEKLKRCRYLRLDPIIQLKLEEVEYS